LQSLRIKETDRLAALVTELEKLGYRLKTEGDDVLAWDGERCPHQPQAIIATYEDHRMAMAFAPLALVCAEGVGINEPQVVSKSYPSYWRDLRAAGFNITEG
jgi:3-phosphoshikimate 1-carboxyvinyltransferase